MASDRRDKGVPSEGSPEYEWLYGASPADDATQVIRPYGDQPDATRVMPVQPAGPPSGPPPSGSPSGPPRPPSGPGRGSGAVPPAQPAKKRRGRLRWVKYLLVLWLVFLIAVPFWAWTRVDKVDYAPSGDRPSEQDGTTYLIVGSDSREGLTEEEGEDLSTGAGDVGQRTDTIMLLHTGSGPNLLMSIPRDSIVEVPDHGSTKINASFAYGGAPLLVETVELNTGIRIDHYVEIGFGGFVGLVDAVGGIEICPTEAMKDPLAGIDLAKGCQEADGKTALGYARSRKTQELGDIDRARHQREVVSAVGDKVVSPWTVVNPLRWYGVNMAAADSVSVGEGTGPIAAARFAWAMTRVDGDNGLTCGVPIADLAVTWDSERAPELFQHIIDDDTSSVPDQLCTPSGLPQ